MHLPTGNGKLRLPVSQWGGCPKNPFYDQEEPQNEPCSHGQKHTQKKKTGSCRATLRNE